MRGVKKDFQTRGRSFPGFSLVFSLVFLLNACEISSYPYFIREPNPSPHLSPSPSPTPKALDSVLVIDASSSMDGIPFEDAKSAAKKFVELMEVQDRAALVWFSDAAELGQTLTADKGSLNAAIDGKSFPLGDTNMVDGIVAAHNELLSNRRSDAQSLILFLSDGFATYANVTTEDDDARADGIRIICVGLGLADEVTLQAMASSSGDYFHASSPSELEAIYQNIAEIVHEIHN